MFKNTILVTIFAAAIFVASYVFKNTPEISTTEIGHRTFNIPNKNLRQNAVPNWLKNLPGLDNSSNSLLIEISGDELATSISGFNAMVQGANGLVDGGDMMVLSVISKENVEYIRSSKHYVDLWNGTERFEGSTTKFLEDLNLSRAE